MLLSSWLNPYRESVVLSHNQEASSIKLLNMLAAGGLYLSDEVQTGFGRCGSHYWGFEMLGVKPDMVSMAKQIGNGFPLAALAMTKEVANALGNKLTFSTYGGSPMAMAAGREALKVVDDEKL